MKVIEELIKGLAAPLTENGQGGTTASGPFTTSATGPWFQSPANIIPAATNKITVSIQCNPVADGLQGLFAFNYDLYAHTNSAGAVSFQVKDDTGTDIMASRRTAKHILQVGQDQTVVVSVDLAAKLVVGRIIGGTLTTIGAYPVTQPNSGAFDTTLDLRLLKNPWDTSQFLGSVDYMKVWFGQATTDGSEPVATPDIEITGPASVVNQHPWKQGADAT